MRLACFVVEPVMESPQVVFAVAPDGTKILSIVLNILPVSLIRLSAALQLPLKIIRLFV